MTIKENSTLELLRIIYYSLDRVFRPHPIRWKAYLHIGNALPYPDIGEFETELLATLALIRELDRRFPNQWEVSSRNGSQFILAGTVAGDGIIAHIEPSKYAEIE